MSLIHTCELNPFDYLTELLRHPAESASGRVDALELPDDVGRDRDTGGRLMMLRSHGRKH
ncbi:MAG: transposase domain-containing protein [Acidobacteriia bacterium]|nr:transposase domain-containing protein [Terriglobia bacterium]